MNNHQASDEEQKEKLKDYYVVRLIDYIINALNVAIKKAHIFSKWILFGSILSVYSVVSSIDQYSEFYTSSCIKLFLVCHFISIISSFIYLFSFELKNELKNNRKEFVENNQEIIIKYLQILYIAKDHDRELIRKSIFKNEEISNIFIQFINDVQSKKFLFSQILFFTLAYFIFIFYIFINI